MKAAWYEKQGPAREVLTIGDMSDPAPGPGEVRIRIVACASPNSKRTENSAIPSRDGCPVYVIPSPSSAKNLSRRSARAVYLYILRMEEHRIY